MSITLLRICRVTAYPVRWIGDNIGLTGRDESINIELHMPGKQARMVTLYEALSIFNALDSYGRHRITRILPFNAENGYLCTEDLAAWQHWCLAYPEFREMY